MGGATPRGVVGWCGNRTGRCGHKVRVNHRILSRAAVIATGISGDAAAKCRA